MRTLKLFLVVVIVVALILIASANMQNVTLHILPDALGIPFLSQEAPLFLVIILAVLTGIILGFLIEYARERRHRRNLDQKRREIGRLREENARLAAELGVDPDEAALLTN